MALDFTSPLLFAGATAAVAFVAWILQAAGKYSIGDIVRREIAPMNQRLHEHLDTEEAELRKIHDQLTSIRERKDQEHYRIWKAIDDLKRGRQ